LARPRWSPANSPVAYTSDEVAALDRYRSKVEAVGPRAESYDLFLCHAWDDRRETATELHNLLEAEDVSVWFSEKDIILGQPFMREIDKGLAKTRIGLVLITPAFLRRVESGGVSEKELSELLSRDLLIRRAWGQLRRDPVGQPTPRLPQRAEHRGGLHGGHRQEDRRTDRRVAPRPCIGRACVVPMPVTGARRPGPVKDRHFMA